MSNEDPQPPVIHPATNRPIFVGGCPRSGTTLLGGMLGAAADGLTVPEATFKWPLFAEASADGMIARSRLRGVLRTHWQFPAWHADGVLSDAADPVHLASVFADMASAYGASVGRQGNRWIDHTPGNIRWASTVLSLCEGARMVNIIRDGRAAAASVMPLEWGPSTVSAAASWWATAVAQGLAAERLFPQRVITVTYEDLVSQPETTLRGLCAALDLGYTDAMLHGGDYRPPGWTHSMHRKVGQGPDASRAHGWRDTLTAREIEVFESHTGELLAYLGYELDYGASAQPPTRGERLRGIASGAVRLATDKARRLRLERRGFTDAEAGRPS